MNIDNLEIEDIKCLIEAYKIQIRGAKNHLKLLDQIIETQKETIDALKENALKGSKTNG